MDVEVDWDLQAVVRGCTSFASAIKQTDDESPFHDNNDSFGQRFQFQPGLNDDAPLQPQEDDQLYDLFKQFFSASVSYPLLPFSSTILTSPLTPMEERKRPINDVLPGCSRLQHGNNASNSATPRSKRRKNSQVKKVCQVSAEGVSSSDEKWKSSWRKYGQKPIKGSPYPRGYYRCSSSKGCPARKQVERNRSDPNMFIVTYTADHNHPAPTHRNSLSGITRPISKAAASSSSVPTTPSSDDENLDVLESIKTEHQEDHRNNDFFDEIARAADVFPQLARSSRGHS